MKKVFTILMCFLFISAYADILEKGADSLISQNSGFYMETAKVSRVLDRIDSYIKNYLDDQEQLKINKKRREVEAKTGIDFMSPSSLANAGVDIERSVSFAYFPEKNHNEKMLIFIPVKNELTFPLKFVEIIKKMNEMKTAKKKDLSPVMTQHSGHTIYQVQKDIFFTAVKGNLVIAPDGEAVKEVIDISNGRGVPLADSADYIEYRSKKNDYDVNFFFKKEFLNQVFQSFMKGMKGPARRGALSNDQNIFPVKYQQKTQGNPALDSVKYISAGLSFDSKRLLLSVGARLNEVNPIISMFLNLIKTGATGKALYMRDAELYSYLSFVPNFMEKMCKKGGPGCIDYKNMKNEIKRDVGIDIARDFIPYFSGVVSVVSTKPSGYGQMGDYVVFLPMNNVAKTRNLLRKVRANVRKKLSKQPQKKKMFGDKIIARKKAFWISTDMRQKNYVLSDKRGIYVGNNPKLMAKALKLKQLAGVKTGGVIKNKMNSSTFFLSFVKKESFITNMMKMQAAGRNKKMQKLVGTVGDVCISGIKNGNTVAVDVDVELISK